MEQIAAPLNQARHEMERERTRLETQIAAIENLLSGLGRQEKPKRAPAAPRTSAKKAEQEKADKRRASALKAAQASAKARAERKAAKAASAQPALASA